MKRFKFLSLLLVALFAVTFTSCLNDDDDDSGLTPAEIQACYNATRGTHTGNLIYQKRMSNGNLATSADTLSTSWNISTDSTMTFSNVPASALATAIADSTIMKAVAEQGSRQNINAYIGYVSASPVQWLINPTSVTYNNIYYGGASHKVTLVFYVNTSWSFGQLNSSSNKQQIQIMVGALYIDDKIEDAGIVQISSTRAKPFFFIEK